MEGLWPQFFIHLQMKDTHFFEVYSFVNDSIERIILEGDSSRDVKYRVEQHWRAEQMYNHRVIRIVPSTYEKWVAQEYSGCH